MAANPVIDITSSPNGTQSKAPPSTHRLATVSASDALQDLENAPTRYVSTGVAGLDAELAGLGTHGDGGFEHGKITELWGPIGAGTTAIALQASANALNNGYGVVWVDCAAPLYESRLRSLLNNLGSSSQLLKPFIHIKIPTLSHLLALLLHPPPTLFSQHTSLLVIDNLNTVLDTDYPRAQALTSTRSDAQKWAQGRRYAILGNLATALSRIATTHNLAVVVTTGCAMRSRPDSGLGGALVSGVGGPEWDAAVWNRLVVFRDFAGRFVGVQKCGGRSLISREEVGETGRVVAFDVDRVTGRVRERTLGSAGEAVKVMSSPTKSRKRNFDEVADAEGEEVEYGWGVGDEHLFPDGTGTDSAVEEVNVVSAKSLT